MSISKYCWTLSAIVLVASCSPASTQLTEPQRAAISDSVKTALNSVLKNAEQLDFAASLKPYSADSDARFIENGFLYESHAEFAKAFSEMAPTIESVENKVDHWDILVLSKDAAAFALPAHYTIKVKDRPAYSGQWVWSGVVQQRGGSWQIVQSHESWLNAAEAMAALMPTGAVKQGETIPLPVKKP